MTQPGTPFPILNPAAPGFIGGSPYGDLQEVTGPPKFIVTEEGYTEFFRTDARSVLILVHPQHFNLIPNPSFREGADGWVVDGAVFSPSPDLEAGVSETDAAANQALMDQIRTDNQDGTVVVARDQVAPPTGTIPDTYYVLDSSQTILKANVPFPLTGDLVGYRDWGSEMDDYLDEGDSWVGRSISVGGDGTLYYQDPAAPDQFIWVGNTVDQTGHEDWNEYGRSGPEWTFSAFFKGSGQVRLAMTAYRSVDDTVMSPAFGPGLTVVADPASAPYGEAHVQDQDGIVWDLRPAPYYQDIGRPPVVADPTVLTDQNDHYVLDGASHLWRAISPAPAAAPLYEDLGPTSPYTDTSPTNPDDPDDPGNLDDPGVIAPGQPILLVSADLPGGTDPDPTKDGHVWILIDGPYYISTGAQARIAEIVGPWTEITDEDWQRIYVQTESRYSDSPAFNFGGCKWIDARVEFQGASGLLISSLMLDPTEHPIASFFDGGMTEEAATDDFEWSGEPNNSVSEYYYDRVARTRFIFENIQNFVPVGRPYQIFFGSLSRPYETSPSARVTTSTKRLTL